MKAQHQKAKLEQMLKTPFYVVSDTDNTLTWKSVNGVKINWSLNEDLTDYHELPADTTTEVPMPAGKKLYLFCTEDQPMSYNQIDFSACNINCSSKFSIGGNACFLSEASCYKKTSFQPACRNAYQFFQLFYRSNVADASNMVLGFSTLIDYCYNMMFYSCKSLMNAPVLPTTTLADSCYGSMFANCTSLVAAPQLPATTLARNCYSNMFSDCTSLVAAPQLPAMTMADQCYLMMFSYCTSLVAAPQLPATTMADQCYTSMFYNCTGVTDLYFPMLLETNQTFLAMSDAPKFGATNATVHYDL